MIQKLWVAIGVLLILVVAEAGMLTWAFIEMAQARSSRTSQVEELRHEWADCNAPILQIDQVLMDRLGVSPSPKVGP